MADNVLREAYTTFLAQKAPCPVAAVGGSLQPQVSLLRQEAMNGTHLCGKLLELLSVILFWFYSYLREFLERTRDNRFLHQLLTALSGNRDERFNSHDGLFRDPRTSPANTRAVARDIA